MSTSTSRSSGQPLATATPELHHLSKHHRWDTGIPPLLRPLVRAYIIGYLSSVLPRIPALLGSVLLKQTKQSPPTEDGTPEKPQKSALLLDSLKRILLEPLHWKRFPTFCAALIGGSTLLEVSVPVVSHTSPRPLHAKQLPLRRLIQRLAGDLSPVLRTRYVKTSPVKGWTAADLESQTREMVLFIHSCLVQATDPPG